MIMKTTFLILSLRLAVVSLWFVGVIGLWFSGCWSRAFLALSLGVVVWMEGFTPMAIARARRKPRMVCRWCIMGVDGVG